MTGAFYGKTVLLTGSTGFIGSHMARRLSAIRGVNLILLSRRPSPTCGGQALATQIVMDCRQLSPKIWREHGVNTIDYVFHLAADTPKMTSDINDAQRYKGNIEATETLLYSLPNKPDRFIFASTIDVYEPNILNEKLTERSIVSPKSEYGLSKIKCEHLITELAADGKLSSAILRYGHIFGPGEQAYRKLIPDAIRRLMRGEPPIIYGTGEIERDLLFVDDAVEATLRSATADAVGESPINIVRGRSYKIRQIVETLITLLKCTDSVKFVVESCRSHSLRFDNKRMRNVLGKWSFVSMAKGLRLEVSDFRNRLT